MRWDNNIWVVSAKELAYHEIKSKDMPKFTEDPPVRIMAAVAVQETDGNIDLL